MLFEQSAGCLGVTVAGFFRKHSSHLFKRDGLTDKVRELLLKHGAAKLSEIDPNEYPALLKEAEVLTDG